MPAAMSRGRGRRTINEINMVPFIDVMLVLLIIFMVTAPMLSPSMVELPSVGQAGQQPSSVTQIVIAKNGGLTLKGANSTRPVGLPELAATVLRLQRADPKSAVVISADRSVKYEAVVEVMDRLQRAGVQRVGLSVQLAP